MNVTLESITNTNEYLINGGNGKSKILACDLHIETSDGRELSWKFVFGKPIDVAIEGLRELADALEVGK